MIHGVGKNQVGGVDSRIEESVDPPPIPSAPMSSPSKQYQVRLLLI